MYALLTIGYKYKYIILGQSSILSIENSKDQQSGDSSESSTKSVLSSVRRFAAASHGHTSPTNGNIAKSYILETAKSPVLRSLTTKNNHQQPGDRRSPPTTAPKPRPWSMATDRKSGKIPIKFS